MNASILALSDSVITAVKGFVSRSFEPLAARVALLENRPLPKDGVDGKPGEKGLDGRPGTDGRDGRDGVDGKPGEPGAKGLDGTHGKDGRDGVDGKDGAPGINGKDGLDGKPGEPGAKGLDGKDGRDGVDGKDGAPGANGKDGVDGKDGAPGEKGLDGKDGRDGVDGVNGEDGAPGANGRDGVDGKDGAPGVNGKDVDPAEIAAMVSKAVDLMFEAKLSEVVTRAAALIPPPAPGRDGRDGLPGSDGRDGVDGKSGVDGFSPEDLDIESKDGGRVIVIRMRNATRDDVVREVRTSALVYRGVFKTGTAYQQGDAMTYGGSMWVAQKDDPGTPGDGVGWKLAIKGAR